MLKKILFVGMYPNKVDKYLNVFFQNLIYAMADNGIECTVVSPVSITKYRAKIKNIPIESVEHTKNGARIKVYFPRYFSASSKKFGSYNTRRITERNFQKCAVKAAQKLDADFDLVYGHFILDGGLAAIKVGKALGIPAFFAYGECDFESQVQSSYGLLKPKDVDGLCGVVSVSSKNTRELKSFDVFNDIPFVTAPNAINAKEFYPQNRAEARIHFDIPQEAFVVGFVGGFIERKGDKRLLEAVNSIDGVFAAFAGKGEEPPSGNKVLFCRALPHESVCDFLNAIDVFVLPTLSEGSCNAIAEAMACGCPIISSDLPFNDDVLNADNSIRVNPNSVDEIRKAIVRVYEDEQFREHLRKESLKTAKNLEIHNRAKRIEDFLYSNVRNNNNVVRTR